MTSPAQSPALPLACVPGAIPAEERAAHFALTKALFGAAVQERRELSNGYSFRFDADQLERVAHFAANERRCCPFLSFTLELMPGGGPLWLRLTGPQGTRRFLDAELLS
jgi:hypothetical protein